MFQFTAAPVEPVKGVRAYLDGVFAEGFPGVEVVPDEDVLDHLLTATYFPGTLRLNGRILDDSDDQHAEYTNALAGITHPKLEARDTMALLELFGEQRFTLEIKQEEAPTEEGQEVERNALLGCAVIKGVLCFIFIEHEWRMINGVIRKQIHVHARPVRKQTWGKEDHLSVVVLE